MLITNDFIVENKTARGSWTRSQMQSLGVTWPPETGWKERVIGLEISDRNVEIFKSKLPAKKVFQNIDFELESITSRRRNLSTKAMQNTINKFGEEILGREQE